MASLPNRHDRVLWWRASLLVGPIPTLLIVVLPKVPSIAWSQDGVFTSL